MTNQEIKDICNYYRIFGYTINPDGSIDVEGNVDLYSKDLKSIPIKFNKVNGYFDCEYNKLKDLKNFPNEISGNVYLTGNSIKDLRGFGKVGKLIYLDDNPLESLEGFEEDYDCLIVKNKYKLIRKTKLKILDIL